MDDAIGFVIAFIIILFNIIWFVSNHKVKTEEKEERKKREDYERINKRKLEISLKGPYGKELSELLNEKARLEAEKTKATDSMAAVTQAAAMFQQKEKDWAVHGGIASGIGGPVIGGLTAVNTMAENQQIRTQNEKNLNAFQPSFSSASRYYSRILVQIDEVDKKIASIIEKDENIASDSNKSSRYDWQGYDRDGYNREGYNKDGYDRLGYDKDGYDCYGYDYDGYDRNGYYWDGDV